MYLLAYPSTTFQKSSTPPPSLVSAQLCVSITLLAQPQRVLSILLRPGSRACSISDATSGIFGHVADALCRVTQSPSCALEGVTEDVAEATDCGYVRCQTFQERTRAS